MLFNSLAFLIFFPLVTTAYFAVPHRRRWAVLLAASAWFYMAFVPIYILILVFTIVIDYGAGILIESSSGRHRRIWLTMSIVANVGVLAVFKYWDFLAENVNGVLGAAKWTQQLPFLSILLPIGLSFHTFQAMSYTIEVYRGRQRAERHFGIYALYVMFYPQLVAGPIERPQNLLPQFREPHEFKADRVFEGLARMLTGLFKKIVIADQLAVFVNDVYSQPHMYNAASLLMATWFFAIQIYCDFSGYSDIALGAARVMGFTLMENFDHPYFSTSVGEFWRRWHISLSTWFKDYVYVPLGGSHVDRWTRVRNILIVFIISGLWHGAAWTFVLWGALHGAYLASSILTRDVRARISDGLALSRFSAVLTPLKVFVTFNLVSFAWIFFRAATVADAFFIVHCLASGAAYSMSHVGAVIAALTAGAEPLRLRTIVWGAVALIFLDLELRTRPLITAPIRASRWLRWGLHYAMVLLILVAGRFGHQSFIYFQF